MPQKKARSLEDELRRLGNLPLVSVREGDVAGKITTGGCVRTNTKYFPGASFRGPFVLRVYGNVGGEDSHYNAVVSKNHYNKGQVSFIVGSKVPFYVSRQESA